MYGELFDIPTRMSWSSSAGLRGARSSAAGCCWHRGRGKIFYFRPGHETYPIYHMPVVRQVIANAVRWAAPGNGAAFVYNKGAIHRRSRWRWCRRRRASGRRLGRGRWVGGNRTQIHNLPGS